MSKSRLFAFVSPSCCGHYIRIDGFYMRRDLIFDTPKNMRAAADRDHELVEMSEKYDMTRDRDVGTCR